MQGGGREQQGCDLGMAVVACKLYLALVSDQQPPVTRTGPVQVSEEQTKRNSQLSLQTPSGGGGMQCALLSEPEPPARSPDGPSSFDEGKLVDATVRAQVSGAGRYRTEIELWQSKQWPNRQKLSKIVKFRRIGLQFRPRGAATLLGPNEHDMQVPSTSNEKSPSDLRFAAPSCSPFLW